MSQENVWVVEAMIDALGRRDVDALLADVDPDIRFSPAVVGGLEGTIYRGRAGCRQFLADLHATWRELTVVSEDVRDMGNTVLVLGRTLARGIESGVELDTASGYVFVLRCCKVYRFKSFVSKEAALKAVGVEE